MKEVAHPRAGAPSVPTQDLEAHHAPLQGELEAAALRVIRSGRYILGLEVEALEREVAASAGVGHAIGVSSGTDALLAMLMALDVGPGDEVVTTAFTFMATAGSIARLGAKPVFADIDPETFNLDPVAASKKIGAHTRAVITVHLFGRMARTGGLEEMCVERGVPLLEDAAQAMGASESTGARRRMGTIGRAAALSFFPSKNLGGFGDGGMVLTNDATFADRIRLLRVHGAKPRYHHLVVGGNFRLDELQAALLRVKLPHLDKWTDARRRVAAAYRAGLAGLPVGLPPEDAGAVWNQYVITVPNGLRNALGKHLADRGVTTAVYYPEPLHLQPCLANLGGRPGDLPTTEQACGEVLALPIFPELSDDAIVAVVNSLKQFFEGS